MRGRRRRSPPPTAIAANVTNELGVGGRTRLLKNVTGLWLLEQCRRVWRDARSACTTWRRSSAGRRHEPGGVVVDPDDPRFASGDGDARRDRGGMCARARTAGASHAPGDHPRHPRLARPRLAARRSPTIERIAGRRADVVHLVGGGAANELLGDLCASALGRPVLAGPVEATVVGNALVQAIAAGTIADLDAGRALVARALPPRRVEPRPIHDWDALAAHLPEPVLR